MSVILYARVSTSKQGEKDLSIPAQLRTLRRLCSERGWVAAGTFTDVASGTSFRGRTGLLSGLDVACRSRDVNIFFVHRLDRLARDMFTYLTIKERLRRHGVRIVSAVENCEETPVGQFIERIMSAQAEFYSANLAQQVKRGIEEKLLRGGWCGLPPLGYLKEHGKVVVDPARARFIKMAFERWATGQVGSAQLADELHRAGLVSRHGKKVSAAKVCAILHNSFYMGKMVVVGVEYTGTHPSLITKEIFDRSQEVFRQKHSGGQPRKHLHFLLARKVTCPNCLGFLVGEQHMKRNGRVYRYYRCHRTGCRFSTDAEKLETMVRSQLRSATGVPSEQMDALEEKMRLDELVLRIQLSNNLQPSLVLPADHAN